MIIKNRVLWNLHIVLMILVPPLSLTGAEIRGLVLGENNQPVQQAAVSLLSLDYGAYTDTSGQFYLSNIPEGQYTLRISHIACQPLEKSIDLAENETFEFQIRMQRDILKMERITVAGNIHQHELLDSYRPVAILGKTELALRQDASIGQLSSQIPGVQILHQGPHVTKPVIRGLSNQRIAIVSDGVQLEAQQWSEHHTPELDASAAEKIEVIRGPASLLYGGDAIGGVVQVWSAYQNGSIPEKFSGMLRLGFSTNDLARKGDFQFATGNGKHFFVLNGGGKQASDYAVPDDETFLIRQEFTGFHQQRLNLIAGAKFDKNLLRLNLKHYYEDQTLLGEGHWHNSGGGPDGTEPWFHVMGSIHSPTAHNTAQLQMNRQGDHGLWNLDISYQTDHRQGIPQDMAPQIDLRSETAAANGRFVYGHSHYSGALGFSLKEKANRSLGPEVLMPDYRQKNGGIYLFQQLNYGKLKFSGGLRMDIQQVFVPQQPFSAEVYIPEDKRDYGPIFSGGLGIVWQPMSSGFALILNSGSGWRAPTAVERYINGVHHATWRYEKGNPDLGIEKAWNSEMIFRYGKGIFYGEAAFWRNEFRQFIFAVPTGDFNIHSQIPIYEIRGQDALLTGAELSIQYHLSDILTLNGGADLMRGKLKTPVTDADGDGKKESWLPAMPADRLNLGIELNRLPMNATLKFNASHYFPQKRLAEFENILSNDSDMDGYNDEVLPQSYTLINALGAIPFRTLGLNQQLSLELRNLLNEQYYSHLSQYKGIAFDPGFNLLINWRIDF